MEISDIRKLKALEDGNTRLKRIVAEQRGRAALRRRVEEPSAMLEEAEEELSAIR